MTRTYTFVAVLFALVAATVIVGGLGGRSSSLPPVPPNTAVNLIAYADGEGRISTVRPDGSSPSLISPDKGFFTWPTWSPDGSRIAFSGVPAQDGGQSELVLFVRTIGEETSQKLYTNEPGMGPILLGMPHYLLWSPDGTRLSFMASVPQGLTLFLKDIDSEEVPNVVLRNSPLYASWSPDSRYMFVHSSTDHVLVDAASGQNVTDATSGSLGYRTPAWLPERTKATFLTDQRGGAHALLTVDVEANDRTVFGEFPEFIAFIWSPSGESLAVASRASPGGLLYGGVGLYSPDGSRKSVEIDDAVIAFFWSPDGTKIAYVTPTRTRGIFSWMVMNVDDGEKWTITDFSPSRDQFTIFQFFDQFYYSHSPWSPDSRSLVFSGVLAGDGVSAALGNQPSPGIYVAEAFRDPIVRRIADGFLAFWSPR